MSQLNKNSLLKMSLLLNPAYLKKLSLGDKSASYHSNIRIKQYLHSKNSYSQLILLT